MGCARSRSCFLHFSQDRFLLNFHRLLGRIWNMSCFALCANAVCVLCKGNLAWGSTVRPPLYCVQNLCGDLRSSKSPRLEASCCCRALFYTTGVESVTMERICEFESVREVLTHARK